MEKLLDEVALPDVTTGSSRECNVVNKQIHLVSPWQHGIWSRVELPLSRLRSTRCRK
jgi:hypothetical protein